MTFPRPERHGDLAAPSATDCAALVVLTTHDDLVDRRPQLISRNQGPMTMSRFVAGAVDGMDRCGARSAPQVIG